MYTYIYTYIHIHTYTHIYTYIRDCHHPVWESLFRPVSWLVQPCPRAGVDAAVALDFHQMRERRPDWLPGLLDDEFGIIRPNILQWNIK